MINRSLGLNIDTNQAHGDVTGLTDSNGDVVATYNYDEFGNLISSTGSIYNPLRYSGANNAYYDSETGLYKMGCRYYMAEVGRWITRDETSGIKDRPLSMNKYTYCENIPINNSDPSGYSRVEVTVPRKVPEYQQATNFWCWATVIQMAVACKKGIYYSQSDIVRNVRGNSPKWLTYGGSINDIARGLTYYGLKYSAKRLPPRMGWGNITGNIRHNMLAIAAIRWRGTKSGHALIIKGYNTKRHKVIYNDPWDGKGHEQTYHDFTYNNKSATGNLSGYWACGSIDHIRN